MSEDEAQGGSLTIGLSHNRWAAEVRITEGQPPAKSYLKRRADRSADLTIIEHDT
jgi:hypothetical protein